MENNADNQIDILADPHYLELKSRLLAMQRGGWSTAKTPSLDDLSTRVKTLSDNCLFGEPLCLALIKANREIGGKDNDGNVLSLLANIDEHITEEKDIIIRDQQLRDLLCQYQEMPDEFNIPEGMAKKAYGLELFGEKAFKLGDFYSKKFW